MFSLALFDSPENTVAFHHQTTGNTIGQVYGTSRRMPLITCSSILLNGMRRADSGRVEFALKCFNATSWSHALCVCVSVACAVHIKADRTDETGTAQTACGFIPGSLGANIDYKVWGKSISLSLFKLDVHYFNFI